jgi:hypothetical protein
MRAGIKLGVSVPQEVRPGIWEDVITELPKLAEIDQRTEAFNVGESIIPEYRTTTSVSVLSGGAIQVNYSDLRYVLYAGVRWSVSSAAVDYPRMKLYLGEVYNGPLPGGP